MDFPFVLPYNKRNRAGGSLERTAGDGPDCRAGFL